ncbi:hypothetical protein HMPREF0765_3067 [Sphingobacterium spiritivorum ATCC 33300]|uniref:Lipoprotein n=1 Tax=Sphingobacterium spiritivorum ATCC 33300 TaxID=525372 RepID=C2G0G7_SPHSI|nr:hypothetical protein HMPREF0765_3067 [Sphingobacterium spiritivorum ATCC 33300]
MKRYFILAVGILFIGSTILSSCSSTQQCAAYSSYPKKKHRTR